MTAEELKSRGYYKSDGMVVIDYSHGLIYDDVMVHYDSDYNSFYSKDGENYVMLHNNKGLTRLEDVCNFGRITQEMFYSLQRMSEELKTMEGLFWELKSRVK